jgi:hypothetical protein
MQPLQLVPRFSAGRIFITANAARHLSRQEVAVALRRHLRGDWGDLTLHDRQQNERALQRGGRLVSVYTTAARTRFYVITESDRTCTTLLLPEDY